MTRRPGRLAVISSQAVSLHHFRGPLIREFIERGVQVFALAPDHDEASRRAVRALGATPIDYSLSRAGLTPVRDIADTLRLAVGLRRLDLDMTFAYFIKPVIYGTLAAYLAGVPRRFALIPGLGAVFTPDERGGVKVLKTVVSSLYRAALERAEKVFFYNDEDITDFRRMGLVRPEKVVKLAATGIDLAAWVPAPLSGDPPTFLMIARLLKEKGIYDFIEAARTVKARHPRCRFLLVGGSDPGRRGIAVREVQAWRAEGLIEWPGQVDDVRPWIARASVYVLPSYYREGVPRSTQEAMAMGRPVITTDAAGCRDTVVDGVNGYLVRPRDPESLARAMEHFIERPELIESMGRESRRLAEERFDVHRINASILTAMGI
jgi:glycosyltransferase involved in cell wall biosynthesis